MSNQRKIRSELRQGLHQFLMQLYMSYLENMTEDEAKKLVCECIEEQYSYFSSHNVEHNSVREVLEEKIQEFNKMIEQSSDYDMQMYYAEKVDALQSAMDIMENTN